MILLPAASCIWVQLTLIVTPHQGLNVILDLICPEHPINPQDNLHHVFIYIDAAERLMQMENLIIFLKLTTFFMKIHSMNCERRTAIVPSNAFCFS